jgi:hypothetical protein
MPKRRVRNSNGERSTVRGTSTMVLRCPCTTIGEHYFKIVITPCEKAIPTTKERNSLKKVKIVSGKGRPTTKSESSCKKGSSTKRKGTAVENGKPAQRRRIPSNGVKGPAKKRTARCPSKTEGPAMKVTYMKVKCPCTTSGEHYFKIVVIPFKIPTLTAGRRNPLQIVSNTLKNGGTIMKSGNSSKKGSPTKRKVSSESDISVKRRKIPSKAEEPSTRDGRRTRKNVCPSKNGRSSKGRRMPSEKGKSFSKRGRPPILKDTCTYSRHVCPLLNCLYPHWGTYSFPCLCCPFCLR